MPDTLATPLLNQEFVTPYSWSKLMNKFSKLMNENYFIEAASHTNELDIIAACENHRAIAKTTLGGKVLPLPQTAQTLLERYLFRYLYLSKIWTRSISYRDEDIVDDGRHLRLFSMLEVEALGTYEDLKDFLKLLSKTFYNVEPTFVSYENALYLCRNSTGVLTEEDETTLLDVTNSQVVALHDFPSESNPYFNMKRDDRGNAMKIDLLARSRSTGKALEVGGFALRSSEPVDILKRFQEQTDGEYAAKLYTEFGTAATNESLFRYLQELTAFVDYRTRNNLSLDRWGGGIGALRLLDTIKLYERNTILADTH